MPVYIVNRDFVTRNGGTMHYQAEILRQIHNIVDVDMHIQFYIPESYSVYISDYAYPRIINACFDIIDSPASINNYTETYGIIVSQAFDLQTMLCNYLRERCIKFIVNDDSDNRCGYVYSKNGTMILSTKDCGDITEITVAKTEHYIEIIDMIRAIEYFIKKNGEERAKKIMDEYHTKYILPYLPEVENRYLRYKKAYLTAINTLKTSYDYSYLNRDFYKQFAIDFYSEKPPTISQFDMIAHRIEIGVRVNPNPVDSAKIIIDRYLEAIISEINLEFGFQIGIN